MHAPLFWKDKTKLSTALLPASQLYAFLAEFRRNHIKPTKFSVPVICVGNVVAGGSGKTPVALALGELLKANNTNAHYLLRGYKGRLKGPLRVDPKKHTALDVGDEALLLAQTLPTWVSADRVEGAKAAIADGAELILMDDGFQNPALHKDISLLVIDGEYGFGNGRLIPAGPLREYPEAALKRAQAIVLMGEDRYGILTSLPAHMPVLRARIEPVLSPEEFKGIPVLAFAGIARPRKFYRTLKQLGCDVRRMVAYPDHYLFKPKDLTFLCEEAKKQEARLVTTAKDYVRLPEAMRGQVLSVPVYAIFEYRDALLNIILPK
jgi:tetraacyldisaccharide 4'-kinase